MTKLGRPGILLLGALAFSGFIPVSHADDVGDCNGTDGATVIKGCTAIIDSGTNSGKDLADVYFNRAIAYDQNNDDDEAISDYSKAIELDATDPDYYLNRGVAYQNFKDNELAVRDYSKAIELNPKDPVAFTNRGNAYYDADNLDDAMTDYSKAISLDPKYGDAYLGRGLIHEQSKDRDKAVADLKKALELQPDDEETVQAANEALKRLGAN